MTDASTNAEPVTGLDPNLAVKTFFQDADWRFKTGVGAVLNASCFLFAVMNSFLVPLAFCLAAVVAGYVMRVIRTKIQDQASPLPPWNDWLDLLISGMTWIAVFCGQSLIVLSLLTVLLQVGSANGSINTLNKDFDAWIFGSVSLVYFVSLLVNFFSVYLMTNLAQEEKLGAAFALRKVSRYCARCPVEFIEAWLLGIGIKSLAFVLPCITVIGVMFLPMTIFLACLLEGIILAQVWQKADRLSKS